MNIYADNGMTASEALTFGMMIRPERDDLYWSPTGSCIVGAIGEAIGLYPKIYPIENERTQLMNPIEQRWPWMQTWNFLERMSLRHNISNKTQPYFNRQMALAWMEHLENGLVDLPPVEVGQVAVPAAQEVTA